MLKQSTIIRKLLALHPEHIEVLSPMKNASLYIRNLINKDKGYPQEKAKK